MEKRFRGAPHQGAKRYYQNHRWTEEDLTEIIEKGNVKKLNEIGEKLGQYYASQKLSTSQLRNILNEIEIVSRHGYDEKRLQFLRYKLAYTAGRHSRTKVIKDDFFPLMDSAIQKVNQNNFEHFKNFVEAIVAYHRYHGGE